MFRALLLLCVASAPAFASADVFGVGDGHSGPLDLSACTGNAYVNEYTTLTSIAGGGLVLNVGSAASFAAGDLVMVWQPAAMAPGTVPSGNQGPFVLTGNTGAFELARVLGKTATALTLSAPLLNQTFTHAQVVRVPEFAGINVGAACTVAPGSASANTPQPWDGATGGIVAFFSDDSRAGAITNTVAGVISADGAGFQAVTAQLDNGSSGASCSNLNDNLSIFSGGSFRGEGVTSVSFPTDATSGFGNVANAGGGGNCQQSAGGGGSNAGLGGAGGVGTPPTAGGAGGAPIAWRNINAQTDSLYPSPALVVNGSLVTRFTFGGGGGHGQTQHSHGTPGGRGGGVVFIRANHLPGGGSIHANGLSGAPVVVPDNDGEGGGGGGGTVILRIEGLLGVPCANIAARGGAGVSTSTSGVGAGGGGSGGRVLVQSTNACVTSDLSGGAGGLAHGGLSGFAGAAGTRETVPGGAFCADSSAMSDTLCSGIDPAKPHCNAAFGFCAACNTDAHCTNPDTPKCDIYSGVCTCDSSDCPASAPVCGPGTCQATCDSNGGDSFCASRFPGTHCDLTNTVGMKGQCVPCLGANNSQCPATMPVCSSDNCVACNAATPASVCAVDHGGLVCNTASGACVQCVSAAQCSGTQGCVSNACRACSTDASCAGSSSGPHCASGACAQCADASQCASGQGCVSGRCGACGTDTDCAGADAGSHCSAGACVACLTNVDCADPATPQCSAGVCAACTRAAGCVGHVGPNCDVANATNPSLIGTCVECAAQTDCMSAAAPRCDFASDTCVASAIDAGVDAGTPDGGGPDAGVPDAGSADAGRGEDAGALDAGSADAGGGEDAGADAGAPMMDAGAPDAGIGSNPSPGCGCGSAEGLCALLALALFRRRFRT